MSGIGVIISSIRPLSPCLSGASNNDVLPYADNRSSLCHTKLANLDYCTLQQCYPWVRNICGLAPPRCFAGPIPNLPDTPLQYFTLTVALCFRVEMEVKQYKLMSRWL